MKGKIKIRYLGEKDIRIRVDVSSRKVLRQMIVRLVTEYMPGAKIYNQGTKLRCRI